MAAANLAKRVDVVPFTTSEDRPMTEKLLSRLDQLAEVAAGVRAKIQGQGASQLDGLAVARLLVDVDNAARKLDKLNSELRSGLFPAEDNDNGDAGRQEAGKNTRRRR
jgi:hypothetical protein